MRYRDITIGAELADTRHHYGYDWMIILMDGVTGLALVHGPPPLGLYHRVILDILMKRSPAVRILSAQDIIARDRI